MGTDDELLKDLSFRRSLISRLVEEIVRGDMSELLLIVPIQRDSQHTP